MSIGAAMACTWVLVERTSYATAPLEDDKVSAVISLDQIDCCAHACHSKSALFLWLVAKVGLTRDTAPNNDHGGISVLLVAHRHLGPWFVVCHGL